MMDLKGFLSRFSTLQAPEPLVKKATIKALKEVLGVAIKEEEVTLQNTVVVIHAANALKHAVLIKKPEILTLIQHELPGNVLVKDIR